MPTRNIALATAALLASAIALYFGSGLHPIWWMVWLAPVPVLLVAPSLRPRSAFAVAFAAWFLGGLNMWVYLRGVLGIRVGIVLSVLAAPALVFGLAVLLFRSLLLGSRPWLAAFAMPTLWVTYEYLNATASPHSTFGNLAYTQMNCLPLIQIASVTGIWGISFIIFLFAATLAAVLSKNGSWNHRRTLALSVAVLICAVILFGAWRARPSSSPQTVTAMLIARDVPDSLYPDTDAQALALFREYADELRRVVPAGTQVVVLPEKIARVTQDAMPRVDALFFSVAADTHAAILVGLVRRGPEGAFNESRFYSADGKLLAAYDKHHLIPGIERELPGSARVVLDQASGQWGLTICKDMDFPKLSREYGADGAGLLLVPAWDFQGDGWLHGRMAVLRGVEDGFDIARSARNGLLTLSDRRGRVLVETASSSSPFAIVTGTLAGNHESTVYSRFGDWFAWLNVVAFLAVLIFGTSRSRRRA